MVSPGLPLGDSRPQHAWNIVRIASTTVHPLCHARKTATARKINDLCVRPLASGCPRTSGGQFGRGKMARKTPPCGGVLVAASVEILLRQILYCIEIPNRSPELSKLPTK